MYNMYIGKFCLLEDNFVMFLGLTGPKIFFMFKVKVALAKIFIRKILCLKVEKRHHRFVFKYVILKQTTYFKNISFGMQLKWGINIRYICLQANNMFIGWMSEDSIFMVNVEQYFVHSRWKRLAKTCLYMYWVFSCTLVLKMRKNTPEYTANQCLMIFEMDNDGWKKNI